MLTLSVLADLDQNPNQFEDRKILVAALRAMCEAQALLLTRIEGIKEELEK